MAALRSVLVAGSLLTVAAVMAPACGGRDALFFDGLEDAGGAAGPGQGGINQGGAGPNGGAGGTPFVVGGFGGVPNTMVTTTSMTNGATSVGVNTVGATSVGVTTSATSGVTSSVATSGVTTSVTTGNSTSAVTTTGGMSTVVTTGGMGGFGGSPTGGGGFTPIDCISCINSNCPQAQACLTNPSCISGIVCTIGTCIQGNNPPNFACVLGCFNGDFMAAFQALGAITCIGTQCGQECQGAFSP